MPSTPLREKLPFHAGEPMTSVPESNPQYPFAAIVGQERMKLALLLNAINPAIGGVLLRGEKGSAKTTVVRALEALLPALEVVAGCPYACDPARPFARCPHCANSVPQPSQRSARVVELPLGATEDRVIGTLHLERAIRAGERQFEPGVLAAAHRGVLYIDEVNLLPDHLVDLLLDVAVSGRNVVEREGISFAHPARFALIGTMNPEEGELRPQLLDRFGLAVEVGGLAEPRDRAEVVRRRIAYEADAVTFAARWACEEAALRERLASAQALLPHVSLGDELLDIITHLCLGVGVDGLRADLTIYKAACAHAAWEGRREVTPDDVRLAAELALPHRRRRPFEQGGLDRETLDRLMKQHERQQTSETQDASGDAGNADNDGGTDFTETFEPSPGARVSLPLPATRQHAEAAAPARRGPDTQAASRAGRPGAVRPAVSGRSEGEPLAIVATLQAAAVHQHERRSGAAAEATDIALVVQPDDLRVRRRESPVGRCILFVVDASGSMAAQRRMAVAKGAAQQLLRDAYQRQERVGLIAFRGGGAELVLPPTNSVELADAHLREIPTGGRTPLAHGLRLATEVLRQPGQRGVPALLVLISDGRANVPLDGGDPLADAYAQARRLREMGVQALVLDSELGAVRLGLAERIAAELGGDYQDLLALDEARIAEAISAATGSMQ
jgi:magnesium chelatase subunit D